MLIRASFNRLGFSTLSKILLYSLQISQLVVAVESTYNKGIKIPQSAICEGIEQWKPIAAGIMKVRDG